MTTRKGINISGHYVVSINAIYLFIYVLCTIKVERLDRNVFYIGFKTQRPSDTHGVLISGNVEFIPTAVSSN